MSDDPVDDNAESNCRVLFSAEHSWLLSEKCLRLEQKLAHLEAKLSKLLAQLEQGETRARPYPYHKKIACTYQ
jgi:hypothetical protein